MATNDQPLPSTSTATTTDDGEHASKAAESLPTAAEKPGRMLTRRRNDNDSEFYKYLDIGTLGESASRTLWQPEFARFKDETNNNAAILHRLAEIHGLEQLPLSSDHQKVFGLLKKQLPQREVEPDPESDALKGCDLPIDGQEEATTFWYAESILAYHCLPRKRHQYLVKWKHYPDSCNSWEDVEAIKAAGLIEKFWLDFGREPPAGHLSYVVVDEETQQAKSKNVTAAKQQRGKGGTKRPPAAGSKHKVE